MDEQVQDVIIGILHLYRQIYRLMCQMKMKYAHFK